MYDGAVHRYAKAHKLSLLGNLQINGITTREYPHFFKSRVSDEGVK
jgi:hypothetical protein